MVRTVHDTVVVDAMPHPEHMPYFVHHDLDGAVEDLIVVGDIVLLFEEIFVVASKWEYSRPFEEVSDAKHEIPLVLWV